MIDNGLIRLRDSEGRRIFFDQDAVERFCEKVKELWEFAKNNINQDLDLILIENMKSKMESGREFEAALDIMCLRKINLLEQEIEDLRAGKNEPHEATLVDLVLSPCCDQVNTEFHS